ncbi:energy transducer TonB [Psychrosphaera algicola]|uniref:Energy transducer TonB n=1 Tax=Psychrosphaera algicola TaxID=3023714 RepID=A0ABT5FFH0_9GAMM|nr:energy transducer TonB [Psychrosphaera sp. G1-22]MDC2890294.1 energy transducer TonB [Psychrosphaera sp. G1-22]
MSFSIDAVGRVIDIAVIESQPARVFDNEAKKALKRWKYKPQIKNGKAITLQNQQIMLEFNLGQS